MPAFLSCSEAATSSRGLPHTLHTPPSPPHVLPTVKHTALLHLHCAQVGLIERVHALGRACVDAWRNRIQLVGTFCSYPATPWLWMAHLTF